MNRTIRWLGILLFSAASVVASAHAANRTRVIINPQPVSQGDVLTLEGIARIDGANSQVAERLSRITLGYAPSIGANRVLTRDEVLRAIQSAGIDLSTLDLSMPESVSVGRAAQSVSSKQITAAVESYVRERYSWPASDFTVEAVTPPEDVLVPQGNLIIRPSLPNFTNPTDRFFVSVALEVDGRVARSLSVEMNVEASATVAVAARQLTRGEAITPENVRFELRRVGADLRRYVTSERELQGKMLAAGVAEGSPIMASALSDRILVKRGDTVNLVARAGRVEVLAVGEARAGGRMGDRVEVLNHSSGRIVVGEITGDKTIKVNF